MGTARAPGEDPASEASEPYAEVTAELAAGSVAAEPSLGIVAGRYRLQAIIARGSMGIVHSAWDLALDRPLALKRLYVADPAHAATAELLFQREFQTLARLRHPRIIQVYDYGTDPDGNYFTMELLDGQDMRELAPLSVQAACRHLLDIASSLALLHTQRLLHRDLSPRNVRLTADGRAKLLDFGALASFGHVGQVVGTPPFIPPESLRGLPLDQRSDIYALGALAYWALTRRHAYPARQVGDLVQRWRTPPRPPSHDVPDVPAELDLLVLSMLSQDPGSRPSHVTEVMERLSAISRAPGEDASARAEDLRTAQSYLSSSILVGRQREMQRMKRRVDALHKGRGSVVFVAGANGVGKSRLLAELALDAQVTGVVVLHAHSRPMPRDYALVENLLVSALQVTPEAATAAISPDAAWLVPAMPRLARHFEGHPAPLPREAHARRLQWQQAIRRCLRALVARSPLLVIIDDLDAADEPSLAAISALSRDTQGLPCMLVASLHNTATLASAAWAPLASTALRLRLRPLSLEHVTTLVDHLFGDVPHTARLAKWLHTWSAGRPDRCILLSQHLVDRGIVRHRQGTWSLPQELHASDLPSELDALDRLRLDGLDPATLRLAQFLSLLRRPAPLTLCASLVGETEDTQIGVAMDTLVAAEVVSFQGDSYQVSSSQLRDALEGSLDPEERAQLHQRLAAALRAWMPAYMHQPLDADPDLALELCWHDLRGGSTDAARGIAQAARRLLRHGEPPRHRTEQMKDAIDALTASGDAPFDVAELLTTAVITGLLTDRALIERYAEPALRLWLQLLGLDTAQHWKPFMGRKLALGAALARAGLQRRRMLREGQEAHPLGRGMRRLFVVAACWSGTVSICLDPATGSRILDLLEPLRAFPASHVCRLLHDYCSAMVLRASGMDGEAILRIRAVLRRLETSNAVRGLDQDTADLMRAGGLYMLGTYVAGTNSEEAQSIAIQLRGISAPLAPLWADQLHMVFHLLRGEVDAARHWREQVETRAVEGGSTWQAEIHLPAITLLSAAWSRDMATLRRARDELERLSHGIPSLARYARVAQATLLAARGDNAQAALLLEQLLPDFPPHQVAGWSAVRGMLAAAWNHAGRFTEAKQLCEATLQLRSRDEAELVMYFGELDLELAVADAGLGRCAEAQQRVNRLLQTHRQGSNPLYLGRLHLACARVAAVSGDHTALQRHVSESVRWLQRTQNPDLVRQVAVFAAAQGLPVYP